MKSILTLLGALSVMLASPVLAQNEFYVTFRGTCWRTNSLGHLTPNPLSEQDLLLAAAQVWGRTDATGLSLVYHVQGNAGLGDTIDVVDSSNSGTFYLNYFGFYFGEATQTTPDRVALTNSTDTMVRRIDHIYTQTATSYTSPNPGGHDMGTGFITKRFMKDSSGNPRGTIDGQFYWLVRPQNNIGGMMCKGTFTTTRPFP
ncbi:MAG: hypothetical protein ACREIC_00770 [Limisphaerales bacterium]